MDGHPQSVHRIRSYHDRYGDGSRITCTYIRLVRVTVASPTSSGCSAGGPGDQEPLAGDGRGHDLRGGRVDVLNALRVIGDDVLRAEPLERGFLDQLWLVMQTSKSCGISRFAMISARSSLVLVKITVLTSRAHCVNSRTQFWRVDLGTTLRCGPAMLRWCLR